ncbi:MULTISPECIES: methylated-DNA--[protein]-cysteine S-methyltransferase [unclassified Endozoicomonas]|uniref:methylated-DNA--[protein]-cysteine S-methyltransferase n=1 Tax=unclassified Endozoicomonas TaxID=2644528 RepID=UPI002148FB1B|nr:MULTISPECIES: methylated-DNA--[protein]-cysteine S-methyltransferase [unclassified Endozoicomonas]
MNTINIQYYKSPVGELMLGTFDQQLCLCDWRYRKKRLRIDARVKNGLKAEYVEKDDEVIEYTRQQLEEYFRKERNTFSVPLLLVGTAFQKQVWQALQDIPYGVTTTYAGLAESIGNRNALRAVANANGANGISILIPCHRVIASNGELQGYAGGKPAKEKLLNLEGGLPNQQGSLFD